MEPAAAKQDGSRSLGDGHHERTEDPEDDQERAGGEGPATERQRDVEHEPPEDEEQPSADEAIPDPVGLLREHDDRQAARLVLRAERLRGFVQRDADLRELDPDDGNGDALGVDLRLARCRSPWISPFPPAH